MSAVVSPLPAAAVARCAKRLTPPRHPNPLRSGEQSLHPFPLGRRQPSPIYSVLFQSGFLFLRRIADRSLRCPSAAPCRPLVLAAGRGFGTSWARREARPAATSGTGLLSFEAATEKLSEVRNSPCWTPLPSPRQRLSSRRPIQHLYPQFRRFCSVCASGPSCTQAPGAITLRLFLSLSGNAREQPHRAKPASHDCRCPDHQFHRSHRPPRSKVGRFTQTPKEGCD